MKWIPITTLCVLTFFQAACLGSQRIMTTKTPLPSAVPTDEPELDTNPTAAQSAAATPTEIVRKLAEFSASNAADLIALGSIELGAPLADFFIAPEVEGYSLWLAVRNSESDPARLEHWDLHTFQLIDIIGSGEISSPKSISGTPDGGMLVTLDESSVGLWDVYSGKLPFDEFEFSPWFNEALIPPNTGTLLAVGYASTDGSLALFDLNTYQMIDVWFHGDYVNDIDFSTDGAYLASGAANGIVKVIEVSRGAEIFSPVENGWVDSVAVEGPPVQMVSSSPILSTSSSGTITLWDITHQTKIEDFSGHAADVVGMDFSPNGEILASGDRNGLLKLWNVSSGEEILTIAAGSGEIARVAFSPDGTLLAVGTLDGIVTIWSVPE